MPSSRRSSGRGPAVDGPGRRVEERGSTRSALPELPDRLAPRLDVLFVGINPGLRSALLGHHFAGHSNRFWKLLVASGLLPGPLTFEDDVRLPAWGCGLTNLVARPTRSIADLRAEEYAAGRRALEAKVRRCRPAVVALVGRTLYHALFSQGRRGARADDGLPGPRLGLRRERIAGAPVFVLPNPSGRNAHYGFDEMAGAFRALRRHLDAAGGARRRGGRIGAAARTPAESRGRHIREARR